MNTEIRGKIERIFESYGLMDEEPSMADRLVNEILALFPSWKTFSNDCLPDKGQRFLVRALEGNEWNKGFHSKIEVYIERGWEWYPIP